VRLPAQRVLEATIAVLDEATEYAAERRRTMIFAVRDRLRAEQRHLTSTRGALVMHSRHLLNSGAQMLASHRALLSAYDPKRRLAQGWSIVTNRDGRVVTSLEDVTEGESVSVLVSDGTFESTVNGKTGALS
jgi:exonuclease VII large subunit